LGVQEPAFVVFNGLYFLVLDPFTLEGHNFFIFNPFFTIVNVLDAPREGVQVFLKRQEQHNLPLGSNLP
jgi:hypothetical protein